MADQATSSDDSANAKVPDSDIARSSTTTSKDAKEKYESEVDDDGVPIDPAEARIYHLTGVFIQGLEEFAQKMQEREVVAKELVQVLGEMHEEGRRRNRVLTEVVKDLQEEEKEEEEEEEEVPLKVAERKRKRDRLRGIVRSVRRWL
jgi:hypothetical protein